ncbi:MAG: SDR family NAD(P)-dependent oxidoreductase [Chitinophagales bacterium]|nr:SDR family NAD(P)-dependent oxidoreductase [Chitinophagales bacterium]
MITLTSKEKLRLRSRYGDWALVTGATSGIGYEIACLLAEAGFNLVICSRQSNRLQSAANKFTDTFHIEVKVVAADLSRHEDVSILLNDIRDVKIGLIVLSAGYGTSGLFTNSSIHEELNMLHLNCNAVLQITHHFANQFAHDKRGGIILLSSMVAFQGVPYSANYSASKAYVQSLAEAIHVELKPLGVDVLAAAPGPVRSGFGHRANMQMNMYLLPAQVGIPILKALGRKSTVLPGLLTKILVYSLMTVPRWAKIRIMKLVMGGMTKHQRS